jgi:hypothetical protein
VRTIIVFIIYWLPTTAAKLFATFRAKSIFQVQLSLARGTLACKGVCNLVIVGDVLLRLDDFIRLARRKDGRAFIFQYPATMRADNGFWSHFFIAKSAVSSILSPAPMADFIFGF